MQDNRSYIQLPPEVFPSSQEEDTHTPAKTMHVPRGGSVNRPTPQQIQEREQAKQDQIFENMPAPSLQVTLPSDNPAERPAPASFKEEDPDSLAEFVSTYPKIPSGLVFQFGEEIQPQEGATVRNNIAEDDAVPLATHNNYHFQHSRASAANPDQRAHAQRSSSADAHPHSAENTNVIKATNPRREKMAREQKRFPQRARQGYQTPTQVQQPISDGSFHASGNPYGQSQGSDYQKAQHPSQTKGSPRNARAARSGHASDGWFGSKSQQHSPMQPQGQPYGHRPYATSGPLPQAPANRGFAQSTAGARAAQSAGRSNPFRTDHQQRRFNRSIKAAQPNPSGVLGYNIPAPKPPAQRTESAASLMSASKPLVDASALDESPIFDAPPVSIKEGMKTADKKHKKGRNIMVISLVVVAAILASGITMLNTKGSITIPEIKITTTDFRGAPSGGASQDSLDNAYTQQNKGQNAGTQGAGSVTYEYSAKTPAGVKYKVTETTEFNEEGKCTFTKMDMHFPTDAAAKEFTDRLARDLGSKFTLDTLSGPNAIVTIDNSGLKLDRTAYENALRYSVDDLVVLKK